MSTESSHLRRKPGRLSADSSGGWVRDFETPQELTKPALRRLFAEAVRNTAALSSKPKEPRRAKRN